MLQYKLVRHIAIFSALIALSSCGGGSPTASSSGHETVEVAIRSHYAALDISKLIDSLNAASAKKESSLGYRFVFSQEDVAKSSASSDLVFGPEYFAGYNKDNYLPIPEDGLKPLQNGAFLNVIEKEVSQKGDDRFIPFSMNFYVLEFEKAKYQETNLSSFSSLSEAIEGDIYTLSTFYAAYLLNNAFITIEDSAKTDGAGKLLWAKQEMEPFYKALSAEFNSHDFLLDEPSSDANLTNGDIIVNPGMPTEESHGFSFLPSVTILEKEIKPLSLGSLSGFRFGKNSSLSLEKRTALSKFLSNEDALVAIPDARTLPVAKAAYAEKKALMDQIEERVFLGFEGYEAHEAVLDLAIQIGKGAKSESFSFSGFYAEAFSERVHK